jgi:glutamyl-tRNA synthetase
MATVRTRIAPSPTGEDLHIGNAYTALINWVYAKKNKGQFIVRIEDTDRTRLVEGSEKRILASLKWLGITPDEPVERQSERLDIYKKHAEELISKGHAYYCFCTPERLEKMRKDQEAAHKPPMYDGLCKVIDPKDAKGRVAKGEKHVVRMNVPDTGTTTFTDLIRGEISFENTLIDDQVILKSDGYPTYHLGVVVDDYLMNISHVIRGEEWISSTPKHILLYGFFGWDLPQLAHMPLLRNPDKSKLSKRKNPVWASWFRQQGFLPEAVLNYLATLAWSFPGEKEIFSIDEMIENFRLEDIQTTAPVFDLEKLKWMNKQYIMKKSPETFRTLVSTASIYRNEPNFNNVAQGTAPLIQPRISTLSEYDPMIGPFFEAPKLEPESLNKSFIKVLKDVLQQSDWKHEEMEKAIREGANKAGIEAKDLFMELRVAITGKKIGSPLLELLEVIGKKETLSRLTK